MAESTRTDKTDQGRGAPANGPGEAPTAKGPGAFEDPFIGQKIGDYRITMRLGSGGFATVYKAEDDRLKRPVALKFLKDPLMDEHRRLFEREAKAVAALGKHPSIVQIYAWGEYAGQAYMVFEYIPASAYDLLKERPEGLSISEALSIAADAADALSYAHGQGILHRDIKPGNILIDPEMARAKLADFGLAKLREGGESSIMSGRIAGSIPYMSPEQTRGEELDGTSDTFSLGVTLYYLLTGNVPFEGSSDYEVMERIRRDIRTRIEERRPGLPGQVCAIVEKATANAPGKRYASAAAMADELRRAVAGLGQETVPVAARPPARSRLRKLAPFLGSVVVVATIAFVLNVGTPGGRPGSGTAFAEAVDAMDSGDLARAETLYRNGLETQPGSPEGLYGLGYALLQQDKVSDARKAFAGIDQSAQPLRLDGEGAVAFAVEGEKAQSKLEEVAEEAATGHPRTLLARLDLAASRLEQAVNRLEEVDPSKFRFKWQQGEYLQTFGQALYRSGQLDRSLAVFGQLQQNLPGTQAARLADEYLELAKRQTDQQRRDQVGAAIERVRTALELTAYQPPLREDLWTSRPLTCFIMPFNSGGSVAAVQSGLTDLLPWFLSERLEQNTPLELVDRELISDVLAEQQLAASLGAREQKLLLGQVLGARMVIECEILRGAGREFLVAKLVDVETTRPVMAERIELSSGEDAEAVAAKAAAAIWQATRAAYPLRGRLVSGAEGPELDIGAAVGVKPGDRFQVLRAADPGMTLPGVFAVVDAEPAGATSRVRLEGAAAEDLPPEGLWVEASDAGADAAS